MKKHLITILIVICLMTSLPAQAVREPESGRYLASTSWTAALASIATGEDVQSIAPADLRHPPEYEITASDILRVSKSSLFIIAGYERMMETIASSAEISQEKVVKVSTQNTIERISDAVRKIAAAAGTTSIAETNLSRYRTLIEEGRLQVRELGLDAINCYININQEPLARDLGLRIAGTFGPAPVTADQIELVSRNRFQIIIDNVHNPVASPFSEVGVDSRIILWRNFPQSSVPSALYDAIRDNIDTLLSLQPRSQQL